MGQGKASVFIVDDGLDNILILTALLRPEYEVYSASSGEEALQRIHEVRPDLVLLDIMMPGMNGYEVIAALHKDPVISAIPVIFITSRAEAQDEEKGLQLGAVDYITKPIKAAIVKIRVRNHIELKRQRDLLRDLSLQDGLTGIPNRRCLDGRLESEWQAAMRHKTQLSLLMMDVDYFKNYNDLYGHQQGDECLKRIARALQQTLRRKTDFVARYGGEEFTYVLPDTDEQGVLSYAQRVMESVRALRAPHEDSDVSENVSLSVGVATMIPVPGEVATTLIAKADRALFQAKSAGRNCSVVASE